VPGESAERIVVEVAEVAEPGGTASLVIRGTERFTDTLNVG
jgi:hypothetical protein